MAGKRRGRGQPANFGGPWTETKLDVLAKYLRAYTTALKKRPFQKMYVDAFAGTGYREPMRESAVGREFSWTNSRPPSRKNSWRAPRPWPFM